MNVAWALTTIALLLWLTVAPAADEDGGEKAPPWAVVLAVLATGGAVGAWTA